MIRRVTLTVLVLALAACGSSAQHHSAASTAQASTSRSLPAPQSYADPLCGPLLREVPATPPSTSDEATAEFNAIHDLAPTSDAPLSKRELRLETAVNIISLDMLANGTARPEDVASYTRYVAAIRQFCTGRQS